MNNRNMILLACAGALAFQTAIAADVTGSGTTDTVPLWTSSSAIGNSIMTQSGSIVSVAGQLSTSSGYLYGGSLVLNHSLSLYNLAVGYAALPTITAGSANTAVGDNALNSNTTGVSNAATGEAALLFNTSGGENTAMGAGALNSNTTGSDNTAVGENALLHITTGNGNIGVGQLAGYELTPGNSNNIDIGNSGVSGDSGVIRIGGSSQTTFYAAGVYGVTTARTGAVEVFVDSAGQLGTKSSSLRYKEDVHDMADASDGLFRLRPVTYRYKQAYADGSKPIDYGLIAEEVAQVYPDLVAKNAAGQVETVEYSKLTPMLVNELQKQHQVVEQQAETIRSLEERLTALEQAAKK